MPEPRLKVLILQEKIPHYRHLLFESVAEYADLTLGCVEVPNNVNNTSYVIEKISRFPLFRKISFTSPIQFRNRGYDVVIIMFNLRWPGFLSYLFFNKARVYLWGHARRVSEGSRKPRYLLSKLAKGIITYSASEKRFLIRKGWSASKIYALDNSVVVNRNSSPIAAPLKECFLYVGALQERKNLKSLFLAYKKLSELCKIDCPPLRIVGDGEQRIELERFRSEQGLDGDIQFLGQITNEIELRRYFESAIAYVSPGATGLGIKHAAGYGTMSIISDTRENGPEVDVFLEQSACLVCDGSVQGIFETLNYCIANPNDIEIMRRKSLEIYNLEDFDIMTATLKNIILSA